MCIIAFAVVLAVLDAVSDSFLLVLTLSVFIDPYSLSFLLTFHYPLSFDLSLLSSLIVCRLDFLPAAHVLKHVRPLAVIPCAVYEPFDLNITGLPHHFTFRGLSDAEFHDLIQLV